MRKKPSKLYYNNGAYKVTVPKALIEETLKWENGQGLEFKTEGESLIITKSKGADECVESK